MTAMKKIITYSTIIRCSLKTEDSILKTKQPREGAEVGDMGEALAEELLFDETAVVVDVVAVCVNILGIDVHVFIMPRNRSRADNG